MPEIEEQIKEYIETFNEREKIAYETKHVNKQISMKLRKKNETN